MVFNSLAFAAFFVSVYALFLLAPGKWKTGLLLLASYAFYAFTSWQACLLLACISLLCFYGGLLIQRLENRPKPQQAALFGIITLLVLVLCYFKYFRYVVESLDWFLSQLRRGTLEVPSLLVPLGVSYYIFQGIGYVVDVFWGRPTEKKLGDFLLFMAFFPKLLMGPIERGGNLLPQLKKLPEFRFDYDQFREGLLLFGWGLFKKLVVADRLAVYVNEAYGNASQYGGITMLVSTVFFVVQLYADFSGYTDMALGLARLFHIRLLQNFQRPFYATTIQDFWRRWHISLSSWIADYVFAPMQMHFRTLGKAGLVICLFVTFLLIGAWHGTGWTFIAFGIIHGFYMTVSALTLRARDNFWKKHGQRGALWLQLSRRAVTFGLVAASMVFFRAESCSQALAIFRSIPNPGALHFALNSALNGPELAITIVAIVAMEIGELLADSETWGARRLLAQPLVLRWSTYLALILGILCLGAFTNPQRFIYFAF